MPAIGIAAASFVERNRNKDTAERPVPILGRDEQLLGIAQKTDNKN
jgi:hypothetical protein